MSLLRVEGLGCDIPTAGGAVHAVRDVSLTVHRGLRLGLVGESGCGKSTLMRALLAIPPAGARVTGRVRFDGIELTAMSRPAARQVIGARIGFVFQDATTALNPLVPIGRQLTEGMRHHLRLSTQDARDRAVELLTQVGVADPGRRLGHYPHQLSGGLRQRITIAMALSCDPDLLIADEATTALDVTVQRQILELLTTLVAERELALILVSHDLGVVAGHTDEVAVMYAGRIVEQAPTAELFARPRHRYTEALLDAIPRLDRRPHQALRVIPGAPPDLSVAGTGCAFAARCPAVQAACRVGVPALVADGPGRHACRFPVEVVREARA
jgi:peptide/nickel transport system ATP-binding protein